VTVTAALAGGTLTRVAPHAGARPVSMMILNIYHLGSTSFYDDAALAGGKYIWSMNKK
jgi:hypothetical protein